MCYFDGSIICFVIKWSIWALLITGIHWYFQSVPVCWAPKWQSRNRAYYTVTLRILIAFAQTGKSPFVPCHIIFTYNSIVSERCHLSLFHCSIFGTLLLFENLSNFDSHYRFEKKRAPTGEIQYSICGYLSVYNYYAYPANTRPRIR